MGFVRERRAYRLVFEDDLAGLEVVAQSVGLGDYFVISELASVKLPLSAADVGKFRKLLKAFADVLVSWNLESSLGVPVPATYEGLLTQDPYLIVSVVGAWMDAIAGVSGPLGPPSSDTERFPEESLPMEALSPSL